jgi:putative transcriptional regulator
MIDDLLQFKTDISVETGKLLIAEPMSQDDHFKRTVVFMAYHHVKESVGYVLNKRADFGLSHIVDELQGFNYPLYVGGPVEIDSLHIIHRVPDLIGGDLITENTYWSGDLDMAIAYIKAGLIVPTQCKFFMGYSGWTAGQLDAELDMQAWLVAHADKQLLFETPDDLLWKRAIGSLGKKFHPLLHVPTNPEYN